MSQISIQDWPAQIRSSGAIGEIRVIQCSLKWTQPEQEYIRDAIDLALIEVLLRSTDLVVTRYILHDVPPRDSAGIPVDPSNHQSHQEWIRRLACSLALVRKDAAGPRLRINRVLRPSSAWSADLVDTIEFLEHEAPTSPEVALAASGITSSFGTTPLTATEISLDGPYGDAEPLYYL
ncbi:MAG: hypothetical protein HKL82_06885 [Acidimicrobiaceae bacterium]|nr:hypothetical protein [Acidimicrobiaceae bacterium]